ncbi:MAG TPA: acyl-CoA dehydrogenase family protein [Acidimicrobiales bacterium]|nr:acyl-CoA dehydrogenase family protein [Acidimicrobiales bacterium]
MELDDYKIAVDAWLDAEAGALAPEYEGIGTLGQQLSQLNKVRRLTYDADWARLGWPERVGGLGGSNLLRAYLGEALTARDLVEAGLYSMPEFLVPTMLGHAPPALAAEMVPRVLRGDETWCQGFSEPGTGSNLAALTCRATPTDGGWEVSGQKVWTSLAQFAQRCVLLTRTGPPESAHRGITAFFVDMDSPGISVRPIETMHGVEEFCEVFFDGVVVPEDRLLGEVDHGWSIAMDLLPYERSTALWQRAAYLQRRLDQLVRAAPAGRLDEFDVGAVTELLWAFRARSRATQHRLAAGEHLGAETSVDKVLIASAEQAIFDLVADALARDVVLGDDAASGLWRAEYMYAQAATIYGGSAEIQRNIIARRVLELGDDR